MVYDVMTAREAASPSYSAYAAEPAGPEPASPQPGWPDRGTEAGPGTGALTVLPRRGQVPPASSLRAAPPSLSVLQRVLRGLERL